MENNFEEIRSAEDALLKKLSSEKAGIDNLQLLNSLKKARLMKIYIYGQVFLILLAIAFMAYRYPELAVSARPQRILRYGTYSTDAKTDECLSNIWKLMGDKNLKLNCPVSQKPYVIDGKNIYCPEPQRHGFKNIYSKDGQVPRIE